jgi:uncharacterized membrane protein YozB (DUF420 family)
MTTAASILSSGVKTRQKFYLIMSLVLCGIAVLGFSRTIPGDLQMPGFPPLLWFHAAAFIAWVALSITQPALVMNGSVRLHRRLGWAGAALACCMVALAAAAILLGLWADAVPPFYPHGLFLVRGFVGLMVFGGLVAAGVLHRRQPEWHKRFMLCASIIVVLPGLERAMPLFLFGADWPFAVDGTIDLIACAGPAADLLRDRRVHPAYLYAVGAIVFGQLATYLIAPSPVAVMLLHALGTR